MRKIFLFINLLLLSQIALQAQSNTTITTFILVRHAEKASDGTDDPDLSPEGMDRAKRLVSMLKNTSITAAYSTKFKRTKNTITPVAQEKNLEVQIYESLKADVLDKLITQHSGGTILIAGHSNTIPQIANQLIGKEEFKNFADTEFGNLLIISVIERGKNIKVTWLNY